MKIVTAAPPAQAQPPLMDDSAAALDALKAEVERLKAQLAELDARARIVESAPAPVPPVVVDPLFAQMWSYVNAPRL